MKALSICQPYAHLIVHGPKRVENRTWHTTYRGPLLIHASKSRKFLNLDESGERDMDFNIDVASMTFGAIVGRCDLVACLPILAIRSTRYEQKFPWLNDHDHTEGPWCWVLQDCRAFKEPIPYRGAQQLFDVPEALFANSPELVARA